MKHKLTPRQREVLEALAANSKTRVVVGYLGERFTSCLRTGNDLQYILFRTYGALRDYEFIVRAANAHEYKITPEGRQALNEQT